MVLGHGANQEETSPALATLVSQYASILAAQVIGHRILSALSSFHKRSFRLFKPALSVISSWGQLFLHQLHVDLKGIPSGQGDSATERSAVCRAAWGQPFSI